MHSPTVDGVVARARAAWDLPPRMEARGSECHARPCVGGGPALQWAVDTEREDGARSPDDKVEMPMRPITGLLAFIGLIVVLALMAAIGLFAYDEIKRRLVGDEFVPEQPPPDNQP